MRILLTNDDGYDGAGLQVLTEYLSKDHEVWVMAPDVNRSAVSHCITMTSPLKICQKADKKYTCSGVPVDCVIHGIAMMDEKPDVVISGINKGANLGTDILYSGTCAAARQAVINEVPGIALSIESYDDVWQYNALAKFVNDNLEQLVSLSGSNVFVNINAKSLDSYKGWKLTGLSNRTYKDTVHLYNAPDGHSYSFFQGGNIISSGDSDCDFEAVENNYISISRVHAQPISADYKRGDDLKLLL
ncbi:MAG: 5'/3'-nucleotidase SurE [Spirochaetaceae bacterium]|nr:5'/3'-nucleotidase SurE [Spirochaetaceae bacterium]